MARSRTTLLTALVVVLLSAAGAEPLLAQQGGVIQVPATAIVRGENIRLRFDPATESDDVTIMQRGDTITITGAAVAADGDEFYPIALRDTGETGWIRAIFINPLSITPLEGAITVVPDVAPVEEPTLEVVPVPVEEETDQPRRNRNADEEQAPADEEQGQRQNRNQNQNQDGTEAPAAETTPVEEAPVADQPVETPPVETPPAELPPVETPADQSGDGNQNGNGNGSGNGDTTEPAPGTISIAGEGSTAADAQPFEARRYRVRALVEASVAGSFRVELLGPDNFSEVLVDDTVDQPQTWISRTAVTIETPGDYVVQVSGTDDPWVVEFLPR